MLRKLLPLALCALIAAHADTTVTATFATPVTGDKPSGSCTIQALGLASAGSYRLVGSPVVVPFTDGALSVSLIPTDAVTPAGQYYRVTCQVPTQRAASGRTISGYSWGPTYWLVPTSGSTLDVSAVEITTAPASPTIAFLPRSAPAGTADGTYCVQVASGIVTGLIACSGGGGSSPATWATITSTWATVTGTWAGI